MDHEPGGKAVILKFNLPEGLFDRLVSLAARRNTSGHGELLNAIKIHLFLAEQEEAGATSCILKDGEFRAIEWKRMLTIDEMIDPGNPDGKN